MSHLVNRPDAIVAEAVDGLVQASGGMLARLDGYPDVKVVVRTDWARDRVALVAGGGAGHEPAHAGFIGQGMLTAAVCGEIFASPSVDAVLAAILAVTGEAGCLVIVKNYTGDRLGFGLAVERARALGRRVEMVVVSDDVALPESASPRGLAGTLLVHKVAGALADQGAPLNEVARVAQQVAGTVRTLGVSLSSVSIPGRPPEHRIAEGRAELGLGIHGEPGAQTIDLPGSAALVQRMAAVLSGQVGEGPLAVLLNNLGGVSALEMGVVLRDLLDTDLGRRAGLVVGPAALMTSLSAQGFSVSALPLAGRLWEALLAPVAAHTAWPGARSAGPVAVRELPDLGAEGAVPSSDPAVRRLLLAVCSALLEQRAALDALDARVGDGDTGSTFAAAARRLREGVDDLPLADVPALLQALSRVLASAMGGSSGVLGSILLTAAATAAGSGSSLGDALHEGLLSVRRYGGASPGDRTLLDALVPAVDVLQAGGTTAEAADAARRGAAATAEMASAGAGRSAHVPSEHLQGVEDPGAAAVAVIFAAAAAAAD